jgi:lipid A 3-O-deacylase
MLAVETLSRLTRCRLYTARERATPLLRGRGSLALTAGMLLAGCQCAHADEGGTRQLRQGGGVYVQLGAGEHDVRALTAGLVWPWRNWTRDSGGLRFTGYWDVHVLQVQSHAQDDGKLKTVALGLTPLLRATPAATEQDHWFVEGGVGLSLSNGRYASGDRRFSTSYNFVTSVGAGWVLGRSHEVGLRIAHASNAGIRQPNPGENLLQLRYLYRWGE